MIDSQHYKRLRRENTDRIPFALKFNPHNHADKSIILKKFKLLQNDSETSTIFLQPPLISFKCDENIGNFLVRSLFQTKEQPGTFECARLDCHFIHNMEKMSGPMRSIKITDHFTRTSANVIYCITCTYCKKLYIGNPGRRLGDRFPECLCDVERNDISPSYFLSLSRTDMRRVRWPLATAIRLHRSPFADIFTPFTTPLCCMLSKSLALTHDESDLLLPQQPVSFGSDGVQPFADIYFHSVHNSLLCCIFSKFLTN